MLGENKNENNLYYVELTGLHKTYSPGRSWGTSYVLAENPSQAYNMVKSYLDANDIGFESDRVLKSVSLVASSANASVNTPLFI
jgi:hypothetical protein